ncbi:PAS domain-containing sensor histidine kinase [Hellea sp.]|nr:PAS domain-containing sensor histidine kinase [Hellea sp.]
MRTGSVNKNMPAAAPEGQGPKTAIPRGVNPPNVGAHAPPQAHASFETIPRRPAQNFSKKLSALSESVSQSSVKGLLLSSLAFFTLFLILASTKLYNDHQRYKSTETASYQSEVVSKAKNAARAIDSELAWMDTALSLNGSPQQIINFVARGQQTSAAALIDASGTVMASTNGAGEDLAKISRSNFAKGAIKLSSLIAKDGSGLVTPVITRRIGDSYLVVGLYPGSLTGDSSSNLAIVQEGGRVIDGPRSLGTLGVQSFFDLTPKKLESIAKSTSISNIDAHEINNENVWLVSARIPNSRLSVIETAPRGLSPDLKNNMILFGLLFAGTAWLVWVLLRNMMQQIQALKDKKAEDEVSQQRYRAAIEGSRGGVWELNVTSNQAFISHSLAGLLGLPQKEHNLSMPQFLGLFSPNDREKLLSTVRRAHVNGQFDIDVAAAHLPISLACRGRPSVRGSDQAKVVIGVALDVTEMRGAQTRLQAAEARLFDALRSMNDSFVIWDQLDRLVLWNNKFEDFFGFEPGNLKQGLDYATVEYHAGNAIMDTMPLRDAGGVEIQLNDGRWIRYLETQTADGGRVSIGTEVTAIRTREHQLQTNQDALQKTITVLRKSQVRIVELAENYEQEKIRAEQASQSKSEFLANMSHELRTPLNAINGFSDIMKKELFGPLGDPRYSEYVNDILFSGQHLLSLINDILDMSKIEAGKMTLNSEVLQMDDMISQVIRIVRGRAEENRLKLLYEESAMPEIEADPRAVKQILLNLTTNAIKFTPEGGLVRVSVEPNSAGLIIRVSDTGIGISQEDIERLAQPFEQIDSQHSRQHEGTGLGLALSKSLVELHGGNFTIESVVGQGTTVMFTLPNRPAEKKTAAGDDNVVGNEITRLAKDIADVLGEQEVGSVKAPTAAPTPPPPANFVPHPIPQAPAKSPPMAPSAPQPYSPPSQKNPAA